MNQHTEQRNSDQIQKDPNLTLGTIESVILASEELDTLTSHRQALDSLATKYKDALAKVQKRKANNDHQNLTAEDEQSFFRILKPLTKAEEHAHDVVWELFSLLLRMVGFDVMMDAERQCKHETRALVYFLLKLRLDQEHGSPTNNAQKQLYEKVAKLCTQFANERKPDAEDDAPNDITPTEDATQDVAPTDEITEDVAPKHDAPKQAGENILVMAVQFILLEAKPQTADALGNTQKQILAEITKLCLNFGNDKGKVEMDDTYQAVEDVRCLANSINKRLGYILAKVEMKSASQRQELIMLVNLNLNRFMDECREDMKRVEKSEVTGPITQSSKDIGTQTYEG